MTIVSRISMAVPGMCKLIFVYYEALGSRGGGGGNYHICWYEMCHILGCLFSSRKLTFGVYLLVKSQVLDSCHNFRVYIFSGL